MHVLKDRTTNGVLHDYYTAMGVDTRGTSGAEPSPPPPRFSGSILL